MATRILVTNDDGIESPGIRVLARRLAEDHEVLVVAPATNMSGAGTGIGRLDPGGGIDMARVELDALDAWSIQGPPGLAVMAAALGAFGERPDVVVSGINAGINTGHSVVHSGTVGAALTAHTFGSHGIAISQEPSDPWYWETAAEVGAHAVEWVLEHQPSSALNINVPAAPLEDLRGSCWAPLDDFGYFSVASTDPRGFLNFHVADRGAPDGDSDTSRCRDGWVTLTPLTVVSAADAPDRAADDVVGLGPR